MLFRPVRLSPFTSRVVAFVGGAIALVWLLLTGAGLTAAVIAVGDRGSNQQILNISARMARSEKYLLPPNPEVGPAEAGAIFHRLMYADVSPDELAAQRIRPVATNLPYSAPNGSVTAPDLEEVRRHPIAGQLLKRVPPKLDLGDLYPRVHAATTLPDGTDLVARLAGARRLDLIGARLPDRLPAQINFFELPMVRFSPARELSHVRIAEIARAIAEHRLTDADRMSRELITIAFVWHREAPSVFEVLAARIVHDAGIHGLAATAEARGDTALAAELRSLANVTAEPHPLLERPETWADRFQGLRTQRLFELARDPELPRAIAIDAAAVQFLVRPCYVYPLVSVRTPLSETIRPHLVHYTSESVWYEKLAQMQPSRSILDWPQKAYDCAKVMKQVFM